jgi:DnaK suppressor protein
MMDENQVRSLLEAERSRVEAMLAGTAAAQREDRLAEAEPGDMFDSSQPIASQGVDDAIAEQLRARLDAVARAEERLRAGTYGLSVESGTPISPERLQADPAAELTVEEASRHESR